MRIRIKENSSHCGSLLVALPTLRDPNFNRAILLLTHHDKESAMGFILNRPTPKELGELIPTKEPLSSTPVFEGGPVGKESLVLAGLVWNEGGMSFQSLGEEDMANQIHDKGCLIAFCGHAGWSGGQLEEEISAKSWHLMKPSPETVSPVQSHGEGIRRWRDIMKSLGPHYHLLSQAPDDISLN